jgi:hypothetical protein
MGPINVDDDYRTLLVDGVVGHEFYVFSPRDGSGDYEGEVCLWADALVRLAEADGLRVGLAWSHVDDVAFDPCVELLKRDGAYMRGPNVFPFDQARCAEWHRPRAEAEWRETLEAARRKAGISPGVD